MPQQEHINKHTRKRDQINTHTQTMPQQKHINKHTHKRDRTNTYEAEEAQKHLLTSRLNVMRTLACRLWPATQKPNAPSSNRTLDFILRPQSKLCKTLHPTMKTNSDE